MTRFRKLTKRLDELIQDSMAVKSHLIPQMKTLCNSVAELVNFGISVRDALVQVNCLMTYVSFLVGPTNHASPQRC
jgi:hypothetical protein